MSKTLITLLSNQIDIFGSIHLINSLKKDAPEKEIFVLTYSDQLKFFSTHKNISDFYSIDREFIKGVNESELYSDSFALNSFFQTISPCYDTKWDTIINFSNDEVSAYVCSMLEAENKIGTYISSYGSPVTSNNWANYLNFVSPNLKKDIISPNTIRHYMNNIPYRRDGEKIKFNNEFTQVATTNFSRIRQSLNTTGKSFMVGLSLAQSFNGEKVDQDSYIEIIETIESSDEFKAVLILSGAEEEKNLVNNLNLHFDNSLISINADRSAFPSVALNLDFLISLSNEHLMFADILETKVIEVRSEENMKRSYINNSENYIIYNCEKNFSNEVLLILNQECETQLPVTSMKSPHKVYMTAEDDYGLLLTQIQGPIDIESELTYHIERSFHFQLLGFPISPEFVKNIQTGVDPKVLSEFLTNSKEDLTDTVKTLLATLRSLKGAKQSEKNLNNFVLYLDELIQKSRSTSITKGALGLFEGRIESINSANTEENMKAIEKYLYALKADLQVLANLFTELATKDRAVRSSEASV